MSRLSCFWLFALCLFELCLFELCLFESFELFGLGVFVLCVGLVCALCFVCAWVSCFGFAFSRFAADLGAGLSESTRCALGRQKARRSRLLLLSTGVICVLVRVCVRVSLVFWPVGMSARGCGRDV